MTETTVNNYQERATRTMATLGSNSIDGAHMVLGITTEVLEMEAGITNKDLVNIREEHGDTNWYIANECNIYGLDFESLLSLSKNVENTDFKLEDIADLHKRELAYGKEMDVEELRKNLISLIQYLNRVAEMYEFSYEESLSKNIDKLYTRYPNKFTQEDALNRNLEAEHENLK